MFHLVSSRDFANLPQLDGKVKDYISCASYYRLIFPQIIDENIDKLLYLDGDIICRGSISDLWNLDVSNVALAAAPDMAEAIQEYDRLGYSKLKGYFNSGVLLINLRYWREHDVSGRCFKMLHDHPEKIKYHDQDVLNIVLCDEKRLMPMRFNVQNGYLYTDDKLQFVKERYADNLEDARRNPVLIHYTASRKPWYRDCPHPYKKLWFDICVQTVWAGYKPVWRRGYKGMLGHIYRLIKHSGTIEPFNNI